MLNLNKNKLIPATDIAAYWGEIKGDISKQTDLVELTTDLDTSIKGWVESKGFLTEHQDLSSYALKSEIPSLTGYATENWVESKGYLTEHQDLSSYALKSEIPSLTGYATESWVTNQGYITSIPDTFATKSWVSEQGYLTEHQDLSSYALKSEIPSLTGYATESWVNEQNYVSDPNNDLAPLFNKQDGYLNYNLIAPGYGETWIGNANFPTTYGARYVFNVGGEVYNYAPIGQEGDGNIYKFNEESGKFEEISTANGDIPNTGFPMWKTPDGFTRYGINYAVDLQSGYFDYWQHSTDPEGNDVVSIYQVYINSIDNVIFGTNGRPYIVSYDFDRAFVWDYNNSDFTITVPVSGVPTANYFRYHCYFNGKYLCVWDSVMYEFVEHFDEQGEVTSVSFEVVSDPYFPLTTVNGTTVNIPYVKQLDSITVYIEHNTSTAYQLVDGVWTVIEGFTFDEVPGKATSPGCTFKDYLFGYGYSKSKNEMIPFYHFGPKKEFYGWDQIDFSKYVTNNSLEQKGYATQEWVENQQYAKGSDLNLYVYDPKHRLNLEDPAPLVDGKQIATTDMCITNSSYSYPGPYIEGVAALLDGMEPEYRYYFTTPSGRIIYTNPSSSVAYEFNGTEWIPLQSVTNFVASYFSVELNDGLYAVNINDWVLYRWDDTNSNWQYIIQASNDNIWAADENTLRCSNNQKLVNNNDGTYQWVEDLVTNYPASGVLCVKLGQNYYYINGNSVYIYNEADKSFVMIHYTIEYPSYHWFTYDGCLYYFSTDGDTIRKVDPSKVGTDKWDTPTDIFWSSIDYVYFEYDNKLWTCKYNNLLGVYQLGYTYSITKSAPEAPTQNGTYVLKATVLNGQVTYSWVVDEVPQAVQITNQILE